MSPHHFFSLAVFAIVALALLSVVVCKLNTSYIPQPFDESLRLEAAVTKTADFDGTSYNHGSLFSPGGVGQAMGAIVNVTARDATTGDETYKFVLQESADNATWTNAGPIITVAATGYITVPGFLSQPYTRLNLDVGGTTPSLTYEAWLSPNIAA